MPTAELISKSYAAQRCQLIDRKRAQTRIEAGDPKAELPPAN